jgi:hypothetical protein
MDIPSSSSCSPLRLAEDRGILMSNDFDRHGVFLNLSLKGIIAERIQEKRSSS